MSGTTFATIAVLTVAIVINSFAIGNMRETIAELRLDIEALMPAAEASLDTIINDATPVTESVGR